MSSIPLYSERELLAGIAAGDSHAFKIIFEKYWDGVYSSALILTKVPELAEDIAQDIFTQLWAKKEQAATIDNLAPYLFTMARNLIYSRLRRESLNQQYRQYVKEYFAESDSNGPADMAAYKDLDALFLKGISQMPPQQQKAFRLSRLDGLNHEEIAREMGLSRPTVKNYIVKSIAFLRKFLEENSISWLFIPLAAALIFKKLLFFYS